ncbi:unnamed protein product [Cuscuta epithymum]|uniref:Uncharacterized protein n=1 Tax=Cuscuta epithymum TaxID=186058 RepID=A0AAV0C6B8_9ASTE|nr:unnamed protein product [Cuscuta epithymum]
MWKVINNLQPFQEKLHLFGSHGPFKRPFCNNFDTRDHCYTSCDLSKKLWTHYSNLLNIVNHNSESLNSVLNHWFTAKDDFENLNSQVAIYICWIIWKRGNMYIHDDTDILIYEVINIINKEIKDVSWAKPFVTKATEPPF